MFTPLYITSHSPSMLQVRFPFDRDAVARLQTIPGAFWHPASDAWLVPVAQTATLNATFAGWPLRWPSGTPTVTAKTEPTWAELLFRAVGPQRAEAVFKNLSKVLHPDAPGGDAELMKQLVAARPHTNEKGQVA